VEEKRLTTEGTENTEERREKRDPYAAKVAAQDDGAPFLGKRWRPWRVVRTSNPRFATGARMAGVPGKRGVAHLRRWALQIS